MASVRNAFATTLLGITAYAAPPLGKTVLIAPGVEMTTVNLGTWRGGGDDPNVALMPWLKAGGRGIDASWDYHDQPDIGEILKNAGIPRESLFITSKAPAGCGNATDCDLDPDITVRYAQETVRQLGVEYVDLFLLHCPCQMMKTAKDPVASNAALWKGAQRALAAGLTRAIGVSSFYLPSLTALPNPKPAVNQVRMSVSSHDESTIEYCQKNGIVYEAFNVMHGCPFEDSRVLAIAGKYNRTAAQICARWVLERGCAMAIGTGKNASKVAREAEEDLDLYSFALTHDEVRTLNGIQGSSPMYI